MLVVANKPWPYRNVSAGRNDDNGYDHYSQTSRTPENGFAVCVLFALAPPGSQPGSSTLVEVGIVNGRADAPHLQRAVSVLPIDDLAGGGIKLDCPTWVAPILFPEDVDGSFWIGALLAAGRQGLYWTSA